MPDETLSENQETIRKSKKVIAFTKGAFLALIVCSFFLTLGSVLVLLQQQEASNARLLDCTVPSGKCYQDKSDELFQIRQTLIGAAVEYCGRIEDTPQEIRTCAEQQLRNLP